MIAAPKIKDIFMILLVTEVASIIEATEAFFEAYSEQEEVEDLVLI